MYILHSKWMIWRQNKVLIKYFNLYWIKEDVFQIYEENMCFNWRFKSIDEAKAFITTRRLI